MIIIGICGSSGSGKSSVCHILAEQGFAILDCDKIYHELVNAPSECLEKITEEFGPQWINEGKLNRKAFARYIFNDKEKLSRLNQISHHYVLLELEKRIKKLKNDGVSYCVIDAPLFFEAGLENKCNAVCAVVAPVSLQIERICKRDMVDEKNAILRIENQITNDELIKKCDYVIENNGTIQELYQACLKFIMKLHQDFR